MDDHSDNIVLWICLNCGQVHFAAMPPEMCDFCADITTWAQHSWDVAAHHIDTRHDDDDSSGWFQLPLFDDLD